MAINQRKTEMLGTIYSMLSLTLGEPIKSFTYAFRDKDGNHIKWKEVVQVERHDARING